MKIVETKFKDCFIIEPSVFNDKRGAFFEAYNKTKFEELTNKEINFVQDNQSFSKKGVLRGLHYQIGEFAQAKLVRVLQGEVLDVIVDLRKDASTYGQKLITLLSSENNKQLYIPRGFAHGFVVLSNTASFLYKCDNIYCKEAERGIVYNDKTLAIDWKLEESALIISEKDLELPTFKEM